MRAWIFILVLLPAQVWAGPLADAQQKFEDMEFETAQKLAEQVLESPGVSPKDLVDAYRIQGLCLSSVGENEQARDAFQRALSIDPQMELSTDTSPKLAVPYYQAKAMVREIKPISLVHDEAGPRAGRDGKVVVELEADPMRLVKGIHLCQQSGEGEFHCGATSEVREPGKVTFQLAAVKGDGAPVTYYFEALTAQGGVLARAGSPDRPFGQASQTVAVTQPKPPEPQLTPGDDLAKDAQDQAPAGLWYETWWFWTAVGVVVAGTAVGLGVGLSGPSGGSIDYRVSVE